MQQHYDIGIAVGTEKGLLVPVVELRTEIFQRLSKAYLILQKMPENQNSA